MAQKNPTRSVLSQANAQAERKKIHIEDQPAQFVSYANACEFNVNGEEVCVKFGLKPHGGDEPAKGVATIYLSLSQFKRLVLVGQVAIETLEKNLGREIELDPNKKLMQAQFGEKLQDAASKALPDFPDRPKS